MKKKPFLISISVLFCFLFLSCNDDDPMIWDFVNYNVMFKVLDQDGTNLMNDPSNLERVTVTYKGKEYRYVAEGDRIETRYNMPLSLAVRWEKLYQSSDYVLAFGEFGPSENYKGETFTIDWGDGRQDKIKFDLFITWRRDNPTIHKKIYLNGKLYSKEDFFIVLNR